MTGLEIGLAVALVVTNLLHFIAGKTKNKVDDIAAEVMDKVLAFLEGKEAEAQKAQKEQEDKPKEDAPKE